MEDEYPDVFEWIWECLDVGPKEFDELQEWLEDDADD